MISRVARTFSVFSQRYANTLFASAVKTNSLETVASDLQFMNELFSTSEEFKLIVQNPTIKRSDIESIFNELFTKAGFCEPTKKAIELMVDNKRLQSLPQMLKDFEELMIAKDKKEVVKVVSAEELNEKERKEVAAALKEYDSSKVYELSFEVNKAILGGLELYFPTAFMDLSLKSRLDKIRDEVENIAI